MRSTTLLVLAALVAGVCAQLTGNAQSAVNAAYQSVVRALDGQSTTVSFARVQSTTDGSGGLVTSSVPNPEAGVTYTTTTIWVGASGTPSASTGGSSSSSGLSTGARVGLGLGIGLTALIAFGTLAVLYVRRARRRQKLEFQARTVGLRRLSMSEAEAA